MNKSKIVVFIFLMFSLNLFAKNTFEGYVKYDFSYNETSMDIYSYAKGDLNKFRLTIPIAGYFEILIKEDKSTYILFKDQKIAMKVDIPDIPFDTSRSKNEIGLQFNGKTKTIAGHLCEQIIFQDDSLNNIEVWFAKDFGVKKELNFKNLIILFKDPNIISSLAKGGNIGTSLASTGLMEVKMKNLNLKAVEVSFKKLKDIEFEIPKDYLFQEMPKVPNHK
jgi:hypothetical protein